MHWRVDGVRAWCVLLWLVAGWAVGAHAADAPLPAPSTPSAAAPIRIVDDVGRTVVLPRAPQRIVSLLPSLTETVCALEQCHRLVGVDRYSNWPESVRRLPVLGGGLDPSIEAVVALRPDVVLLATSSRAMARLQELGLVVVALEPRSHADVQRVLGVMGQILDVPDAQKVWRHIDTSLQAAAQSLSPDAKGRRVYFEINSALYAAGAASFIGQTLSRLGMGNIVPANLGPFPQLNPEFVVRADPDIIIAGQASYDTMAQRPGWQRMTALRQQQACVLSAEQSDTLVRAGPRMAQGARLLAQCFERLAVARRAKAPTPATSAPPSSSSVRAPQTAR